MHTNYDTLTITLVHDTVVTRNDINWAKLSVNNFSLLFSLQVGNYAVSDRVP